MERLGNYVEKILCAMPGTLQKTPPNHARLSGVCNDVKKLWEKKRMP